MVLSYLALACYAAKCFGEALMRQLVPTCWWSKKSLCGKVVLITGSGKGIGRELAVQLARKGCRLALWSTTQATNEDTAEQCRQLGAEAVAYTVDISNRAMVYKLAEDVHQRFGTVDVVINNAGVSTNGTEFLKTADEDSERVIDVNLKSLIWMAKSFLPQMLERRSGHFVCIGSMLSFMTIPELVEYVASKFGMFGVMETLEHSFWFRGIYDIKFTTCFPCWVSTPMVEGVTDFGGWPLITPSECARQIIDGIELERRFVFIPGREAWLFFFKGLLPWNLYSKLLLSGWKR